MSEAEEKWMMPLLGISAIFVIIAVISVHGDNSVLAGLATFSCIASFLAVVQLTIESKKGYPVGVFYAGAFTFIAALMYVGLRYYASGHPPNSMYVAVLVWFCVSLGYTTFNIIKWLQERAQRIHTPQTEA